MKKSMVAATIAAITLASVAQAKPLVLYPVAVGNETAHYHLGVPTVAIERPAGAVQITPLPFDHGHVALGIGLYNTSKTPVNFGIENVTVTVNGQPVPVLSSAELQSRAKSRALWSSIAVGVLAAGAAAAVANAHNTNSYRSYTSTPFGTVRHVAVWRDNTPGILGATAATAGGVAGIVGIQNRLDYTLEHLATDVVQTTTIEPDASYGGQIILEKTAKFKLPYDVLLNISWNGEKFPVAFRVTKAGVAVPPPLPSPPAPPPVPSVTPIAPLPSSVTPPASAPTGAGAALTLVSAPATGATRPKE